jgi:hypothetical protein
MFNLVRRGCAYGATRASQPAFALLLHAIKILLKDLPVFEALELLLRCGVDLRL